MNELRVNNKLWIISDTHFGHQNIIKFQQRPMNHEVIMLSNWIERVKEDDQILHLGDVFMGKQGNPKRWAKVLSRMPGEKFLIKGNHDNSNNELYTEAGFTIVDPFMIVTPKNVMIAFTHIPISEFLLRTQPHYVPERAQRGEKWDVNIHGHTHANAHHPEEGSLYVNKMYINVCVELTDLAPRQLGSIFPLK